MKTLAKEFTAALARVLPVLKGRTTIPVLSCVKLEAKDNRLTITGTDLDAYAAAICPCVGDLPALCVDATILNHLAHQAEQGISMEVGMNRLIFASQGSTQLAIHNANEFPDWPDETGTVIKGDPAELAQCIKGTCWATSTGRVQLDFWMECVWIKSDGKSIECCGTDSKELAYVKRNLACGTWQLMMPAKHAPLLIQALETGAEKVWQSRSFICADSPTLRVAIKLAEGKYAPIEYLLNQKARDMGELILPPLIDSLGTIKVLGGSDIYLECRWEFSQGEKLTILFKSEQANFERSIPFTFSGEDIAIRMDPVRALHLLNHVPPGAKFSLSVGSILIYQGDYTYALALLM